jgi:hypothetical protein
VVSLNRIPSDVLASPLLMFTYINSKQAICNMTEHEREQIANQRLQLIAPIIKHPDGVLSRGQRYECSRFT